MKNTDQSGWVKIHRKILENPISSKPQYLAVWVHLLLMASHKDTSFIWNNKKVLLKEGQFITGRKKISLVSGVKESSVEKILKYLELEHQIEQQKTRKYRVITIVKWKDYQKDNIKSNNRVTTEEHNQELKNYKKDTLVADATPFSFEEELKKLQDNSRKDLKIIALYWRKKGFVFENRKQFESALKRELRPSKELTGYSGEQIARAIRYCQENYEKVGWTLETIHKRISDLVNK